MTEKDISEELRLKKVKKKPTMNKYFIKAIDQNELFGNVNKNTL